MVTTCNVVDPKAWDVQPKEVDPGGHKVAAVQSLGFAAMFVKSVSKFVGGMVCRLHDVNLSDRILFHYTQNLL